MTKLHMKRFEELTIQLKNLEATKKPEEVMYRKGTQGVDTEGLLEWKVKVRSLLSNVCGIESQHFQQFEKNEYGNYSSSYENLLRLKAVFNAAKEDFEGGYL
jgi:hypothetical protein